MRKIILVTGGAGFVGSHLVRRLVNDGNAVVVIDNLITTHSTKYIKDLIDEGKVEFIERDITSNVNALLDDTINAVGRLNTRYNMNELVSEVYNLASPASVKLYTAYPDLTFRTSTIGVSNILSILSYIAHDDVKFLETSTSECYGDPLVNPQPETYFGNVNTQCERSCYDEGKRGAEVLCYLANKRGIDTHIARLFNVYGPNNTDDRVVPTFITQALEGKDITVHGSGNQTRSFCYVDDIVKGLIKLNRSSVHSPVNLGRPQEITINELASVIVKLTESKSNIIHDELPEFDPVKRCPDISKAKSELNWEPTTSLEDGLSKVIEYIKSNVND